MPGSLAGAAGSQRALAPDELAPGRWIVRLTPEAVQTVDSVAQTEHLLNQGNVDFQVIRGLGLAGQLLVRADGSAEKLSRRSPPSCRRCPIPRRWSPSMRLPSLPQPTRSRCPTMRLCLKNVRPWVATRIVPMSR